MDTNNNPFEEWIEYLVQLGNFEQRIDIHSAYHVMSGDWHDSFVQFEKDLLTWVPSESNASNLWLRDYINATLSSTEYVSKFGEIPYLVGSEYMGQIHNFGLNRRSFAEFCLKNKYNYNPDFVQINQGALKMLNFWGQFEPAYWELGPTSANQIVEIDSPPRRDSFAAPISLVDRFQAGIVAVDFIYNLSIERRISGLPYIIYTEDIRNSYFRVGALMAILWKSTAFPMDKNLIKSLSKQSFNNIVKALLSDARYTSQNNFIWSESDEVENAPNWKSESWFGYFMDAHFPWVYHEDLGWIYIAGVSPSQFWFYSKKTWLVVDWFNSLSCIV